MLNENDKINKMLNDAAENTVASFIIEIDAQNDQGKILEFSLILNSFIEYSQQIIKEIEDVKSNEDFFKIACKINNTFEQSKIKQNIYEKFPEYQEYIWYAIVMSINDAEKNLDNFAIQNIHYNLIEHFLTILPMQDILSNNPIH